MSIQLMHCNEIQDLKHTRFSHASMHCPHEQVV